MPIYEVRLRIEKPYPPDEGMIEEALARVGVEPHEHEVVGIWELQPPGPKLASEVETRPPPACIRCGSENTRYERDSMGWLCQDYYRFREGESYPPTHYRGRVG